MLKVDSHQHFWKFDPVRDSWINESMAAIQRDFLPEDLKPLLDELGLDGCVAVQASQSEAENEFLLGLAAENYFIKGVVGWVDLQSYSLQERLEYYSQHKKLKGFRHVLQDEEDRLLMIKPVFMKGISLLAQFGFTYDILIYPDQLIYVDKLVKAFPAQKFVIDHLAKPHIKHQRIDFWEEHMRAVAKFENVSCKVSGMVTEADWNYWEPGNFTPYLDVVFEAFGPNRVMFGSDWPVCNVAGGCNKVIGIVKDYTAALSASEQEAFWGGNAVAFYGL